MSLNEVFDGKGNKHTIAGENIMVVRFDMSADFATLVCTTHTAAEIDEALHSGIPVMALVADQGVHIIRTAFCWAEDQYIKVGCSAFDGGWSHERDVEYYYMDGNIENKTKCNELWLEY